MPSRKFKVGQSLVFSPRRIGNRDGNHACKVVQLMPVEDGEYQSRIPQVVGYLRHPMEPQIT